MPRIADEILECVFYLYKSKQSAEERDKAGGSGFFVGIPLEKNSDWAQVYAITCWHNIVRAGDSPTMRFNKKDGSVEIIQTAKVSWEPHPNVCDVAVLPLDFSTAEYRVRYVSAKQDFMTKELFEWRGIGPGDDVFMVGRLVGRDGKQQNTPSVRFGNISMTVADPIKDEYGTRQESFVVECRSLPGYSGSPVFVTVDPTLARPPMWLTPAAPAYQQQLHGPWLLGIDWCHIHDFSPVFESDKETPAEPKQWVKTNTGMAGVVPAWKIMELLDSEPLKKQRLAEDERVTQTKMHEQKLQTGL